MKNSRQARQDKLLEIIDSKIVTTQEELLSCLKNSGFNVTQATVSRDIKELRIIKTLSSTGEYYYTHKDVIVKQDMPVKLNSIFMESIKSVDWASNFVVIKCYAGMANAVCASIDNEAWDGLLGTIAGDDTIFMLLRTEEYAMAFAENIKKIVAQSDR